MESRDNDGYCTTHRGPDGSTSHLDPLLQGLPGNQGGLSRHSCVYCAYERGVARGREQYRNQVADFLACKVSELPE